MMSLALLAVCPERLREERCFQTTVNKNTHIRVTTLDKPKSETTFKYYILYVQMDPRFFILLSTKCSKY